MKLLSRLLPATRAVGTSASSSRASFANGAASLRKKSPLKEEMDEDVEFSTYEEVKHLVHPALYKAVTEKPFQYKTLTPVQSRVLSLLPALAEPPSPEAPVQDLLVRAKTGTGKTLAFLLPALQGRIRSLAAASSDPSSPPLKKLAEASVGALIISPTRELAAQIHKEATLLASHLPSVKAHLFVGGDSKYEQLRTLSRNSPDIFVGTPGRILDLLQSQRDFAARIAQTRLLVLDEADTLLDMGFQASLDSIREYLPEKAERQTFLFSATVSKAIQKIASASLKPGFEYIDTIGEEDQGTHEHVQQRLTVVPPSATVESETADDPITSSPQLSHVLSLIATDQLLNHTTSKIIIFLPTTRLTQLYSGILSSLSYSLPYGATKVIEIHSKKDQKQRSRASNDFRSTVGRPSILVTSDVSARGVDYPGVTRVIQVGLPRDREGYVHRVGRTGRAGKDGRGDIVVMPWEEKWIRRELGHDVKLEKVGVEQVRAELEQLALEVQENPPPKPEVPVSMDRKDRKAKFGRVEPPLRPATLSLPLLPRLSELTSPSALPPSVSNEDLEETFLSLLGYYIPRASDLGFQAGEILDSLKAWTVGMGAESAPFVSDAFLKKLGVRDGGRGRERGGGGNIRGQFGGFKSFGDRNDSRGKFSSRGRDSDRSFGERGSSRGFGGQRSFESRERSFESREPRFRSERRDRDSSRSSFNDGEPKVTFGYGKSTNLFSSDR